MHSGRPAAAVLSQAKIDQHVEARRHRAGGAPIKAALCSPLRQQTLAPRSSRRSGECEPMTGAVEPDIAEAGDDGLC